MLGWDTILEVEPNDTGRVQLLERILASTLFRKSPRLSGFLRFVYEEQNAGRGSLINEQLIGTKVFGRRSGYHVGEDSIVRSQARFLRQRLEQYFVTEGRNEPIILTIPKGSYIPAFVDRKEWGNQVPSLTASFSSEVLDGEPEQAPEIQGKSESALPPSAKHFWTPIRAIAVGCFLLLVVISCLLAYQRKPAAAQESATSHAFWASIFAPNRSVLFIPADSSLVIWERIGGKRVPLRSYMTKSYMKSPPDDSGVWERLANSGYTSIADLNLVSQLDRIPAVANSRFGIRYAGDLSLSELKAGNAILSGGPMANPWVQLFDPKMHLTLDYNPGMHHPFVRDRPGDQKPDVLYMESDDGGPEGGQSYGVIGYLPSLDGQGHNLLLEGTTQAGTDAAAEFLRGNDFIRFLHDIGATPTNIPNFEVLIMAKSLVGGAYSVRVVSWDKLPTS